MKKHFSPNRFKLSALLGGAALIIGAMTSRTAWSASHEGGSADRDLKLGVATYSLGKFPVDEAIEMIRQLGVKYASIKSFHLAMDSSTEERKDVARKFKEAGITLLSGGVINLTTDEAQVRNAFEYARDVGIGVIVANLDPEAFGLVDKMVKEFDIKVAIHNHGPNDKRYPSPLDAYRKALPYDQRIGVCMDVGHSVRNGDNEIEDIHTVKDRLYDVHLKDVTLRAAGGQAIEVGKGVVDIPGVLKALREVGFTGDVGLEYEKDSDHPMEGMRESFAYIRGVLDGLSAQ